MQRTNDNLPKIVICSLLWIAIMRGIIILIVVILLVLAMTIKQISWLFIQFLLFNVQVVVKMVVDWLFKQAYTVNVKWCMNNTSNGSYRREKKSRKH